MFKITKKLSGMAKLPSIALLLLLAMSACNAADEKNTKSNAASAKVSQVEVQKPNIIFIFADDLGWGDISLHGSKTIETPNLDQLAQEGSEFYQFSVANPVCSPSRVGVITGHNPARHSVHHHFADSEHHQNFNMPDWLPPSVVTMPKVLKTAGYVSGHFGKWHLTNSHIPDAPTPDLYGYDESAVFNGPGKQTDAWKAYDDTIDFIKRNKDKPFFINLWIHEPHTPHYPLPEMMKKYAHLGERKQVYAATVSTADLKIGEVLDTLKNLGLEENTLVVFTSDNGPERTGPESRRFHPHDPDAAVAGLEPFGTYFSVGETAGLRGRKRHTYEGGVREPFFVKWPGKVPAGVVNVESVISSVDLLSTFAEVAGAELPQGYESDGESVLAQFQGEFVKRKKPVFWEWYAQKITSDADYDKSLLVAREGAWKLFFDRRANTKELYNLMHDRNETRNLAEQFPEIVKDLTDKALAWKATLPRSVDSSAFTASRKNAMP